MQYKIPVQIENEDPIILWLSLRQLTILIIGSGIWYTVFKSLLPSMSAEVAAIPWIIIAAIALLIAVYPANIYLALTNGSAMNTTPLIAWGRLPFQFLFIYAF